MRQLRAEDRGPASGRQLIDEPMGVGRQPEQDILEVRERRDVDEFAALDKGIEERGPASPFEAARKEPVSCDQRLRYGACSLHDCCRWPGDHRSRSAGAPPIGW
jgi:hypothetical protein